MKQGAGKHAIFLKSLLLTVLLIFAVGGCKGNQKYDEIKVGAILPLTGQSALLGEMSKNGLILAEHDINARGGISGKKVKIVFEDGMGDPKNSVAAFNKLINSDKIKYAITTHSGVGLALAPIAEKEKIILFVHASHPLITKDKLFVFRHSNIAEQESEVIGGFVADTLKSNGVALAVMNDDYGLIFKDKLSESIKKIATDSSINRVIYDQAETDFKSISQKLLSTAPKTIIVAGLGNGVGLLLKRLKEYGYNGDVVITLGAAATGAFKSAGATAKGVYFVDLVLASDDTKYSEVGKKYKEDFRSDMTASSVLFYNSLQLLAFAIEKTNDKPNDIYTFLNKLGSFKGVGEQMTMVNGRDIIPPLRIIKNE